MSRGRRRGTDESMLDLPHAVAAQTFPEAAETGGRLARLVDEAAQQITRFTPPQGLAASQQDAVIIDIRSADARVFHGIIPASLHIPRTVLEWRVALDSAWRNPHLGDAEQRLILVCDHGYSSILAASNIVRLGFPHAGDIIGGFEAWKASGLPVSPCPIRFAGTGALPGAGPPD